MNPEVEALRDRAELADDLIIIHDDGSLSVPAELAPVVVELVRAYHELAVTA